MNKIYMKPVTSQEVVDIQPILGGSPLNLNSEGGSGTLQTEEAQEDALSRGSFWDE